MPISIQADFLFIDCLFTEAQLRYRRLFTVAVGRHQITLRRHIIADIGHMPRLSRRFVDCH